MFCIIVNNAAYTSKHLNSLSIGKNKSKVYRFECLSYLLCMIEFSVCISNIGIKTTSHSNKTRSITGMCRWCPLGAQPSYTPTHMWAGEAYLRLLAEML